MYAKGVGIDRNYKLALNWFFRAQALGSTEAMANLGTMYEKGAGIPQSNAAAFKYYRDAAIDGLQPAILRMVEIYEKGELDVAPDPSIALEWRSKIRPTRVIVSAPPVASAESTNLTADPPRTDRKEPAASPSKRSAVDKAAGTRIEQFEKLVFSRLENYRLRERKRFVASTDDTPALAKYLGALRLQISNLLANGLSNSKLEAMIITLSIRKDGTVKDVELSEGSGDHKIDRRVVSSLKQVAHFPPLPEETVKDTDVLVVVVRLPIA